MENNENIKNIIVINEYDDEKKEWEPNRVVFFMQGKAPVISDFYSSEDEQSPLNTIADFIEKNGFDIQNDGLKNAIKAGIVDVISARDKKKVATLDSEILEEQLKYSNSGDKKDTIDVAKEGTKEGIPAESTEEFDSQKAPLNVDYIIDLSTDDKALLLYFKKLERLKRKRTLAKEGLLDPNDNDINECIVTMTYIAEHNSRVAVLEKARLELEKASLENKNNEVAYNQYYSIYFRYIKELSDSIKKAWEQKENMELAEYEKLKATYQAQLERGMINEGGTLSSTNLEVSTSNVPPKVAQQYRRETILTGSKNGVINLPESLGTPNYNGSASVRFAGKTDKPSGEFEPPKVSDDYRVESVRTNGTRGSKESVPNVPESDDTKKTGIPRRRRKSGNGFVLNEVSPINANGVKGAVGESEEIEVEPRDVSEKEDLSSTKDDKKRRKKVKITWTNKLKNLIKGALIFVAGGLGVKFIPPLFNKAKDTVSKITQKGSYSKVTDSINNYCEKMGVPSETKQFLNRIDVQKFLSQYKNQDQLNEVISAICFGYEANMLTSKDGNFKLYEDGNYRLKMFTNDFLCAKAVVNGYTPSQLLAVFGGSDISVENLMNGFKQFCNTNMVYGTTATKTLPYRYLTNGNSVSTPALNYLFEKLSVVNANRKAGTLTSRDTDAFIVAVHNFFTQSGNSVKYTEGERIFATSIVESFVAIQSNVASAEPLYLHAEYDHIAPGTNLHIVDGEFKTNSGDNTAYEFTNLYDVVNGVYGAYGNYGDNCKNLQQTLEDNLHKMNLLASGSKEQATLTLASALYKNGLDEYADKVTNGRVSQNLLDEIENANPALADEIDEYQRSITATRSNYVPFNVTVGGVDELLGIKGFSNTQVIPDFINTRRELAFNYDNYKVLDGKWHTRGYKRGGSGYRRAVTETVTTTRQEEVDYSDLSSGEKQEADKKREELQKAEDERLQAEVEKAKTVAQGIVDGVENGTITTQEEAQKIADSVGMTLETGIVDTIKELHEKPGLLEEKQKEMDAKNAAEIAKAEAAAKAVADAQAQAALDQANLINQSLGLGDSTSGGEGTLNTTPTNPTGTPQVDASFQIDPNRVDTSIDEEPYVPSDTVSSLQALKAAALAAADMVPELDTNGPQKTLTRNA